MFYKCLSAKEYQWLKKLNIPLLLQSQLELKLSWAQQVKWAVFNTKTWICSTRLPQLNIGITGNR